ncbi:unnamed protein product [Candidula unifasciata]|uniref:RING-type domain-containing protein n=1 Tax=Candidula unifasciata TaxID=100452 RepID=A0A8S3ZIS5_9EUPU|nr:unnamed protein product [Candidula unifasciata]
MNDIIDDIHKSLSPSCPMVIVQFSNNVASNMSSPNVGNASSGPYTSESPQPVAVGNSVSSSQSTSSESGHSGYDDVDYRRTNASSHPTTEATQQSSYSQRADAVASSVLADANRRLNTPRSSTHAPVLPLLGMLNQEGSLAVRNNMINHGSQNADSSDGLNEESRRNLQNGTNTYQDNVSHHPSINTQVYAIPPGSNGMTVADTSNSAQSQSQLTYQLLGIFHERPKFPNYAVLARRLQSFDGWSEQHPIKKEDLVKSGLFFAGYGDCCKCFFCGGGLRNWESGDNAYVEHARWFDKCSFIRQFMGLEFVEAVQCLKNRGGTITFKDVTDYMQKKGQSIQNLFNDKKISDDVAVRSLVDAGYNLEDVSRAALSLRESGEQLSADVILRRMRDQQSEVNGATPDGAAISDRTKAEDVPDEGRLQALKEQNYALRSNLTCKICMDKEVKIVFLPCGHLISCQECAVALQDCPLCRSHIRARARANIN